MKLENRKIRAWLVGVVAILTVALVAACGGGSQPTATPAPTAAPTVAPADTPTPAPAATEAATETVASSAAVTDTENVTDTEEVTATVEATVEATEEPAEEATVAPSEEVTATESVTGSTTGTISGASAGDLEAIERNNMYTEPFAMTIDPEKIYYATIHTDKGDIKVQLFADRAPVTVNNFVNLAREGFYDNTSFHRVLADFMAQAGDPTGTGTGGPGYTIPDEFVPGLNFDRAGLLAMANTGMPGSGGSQWFLTFGPTEWLNQRHTIFGEVVDDASLEVLSAISLRDPATATEPGDTITSITIEESDESILPTPTPAPPTPTPFAPSSLDAEDRPLAAISVTERINYFSAPPEMTIDPEKQYTATISTSAGDLTVALNTSEAPVAVNNFVTLANLGFYDSTPINQVNPGTLLVIGSPDNILPNDVGYVFVPETNLESDPTSGSMAFAPLQPAADGSIEASGSILLIALSPPPADSKTDYGFFGTVVADDLETLTALAAEDTIETITITESE